MLTYRSMMKVKETKGTWVEISTFSTFSQGLKPQEHNDYRFSENDVNCAKSLKWKNDGTN